MQIGLVISKSELENMKPIKIEGIKKNGEINPNKQSGKSTSVTAKVEKNVGNESGRVCCEEIYYQEGCRYSSSKKKKNT